jgi:uncharacterized protein
MFVIDVAQIPAEGLEIQVCEGEDFLDSSREWVSLLRPVEATLHFARTPAGVSVRGHVSSDLQLHCSRCFESFTLPVREGFEVEYRGPIEGKVEEEHELGADELDVSFYEGARINVTGLVRENVLLALPVQPLCHVDCRGLCPRCGANRNGDCCPCSTARRDPRWQKLESLR